MTYEYILWRPRMKFTSDTLKKMSDNDQLIVNQLAAGPQGVIGWKQATSATTAIAETTISGLSITIDVEANRMTKFTFFCPWIYLNTSATAARTRLQVDGTTVMLSDTYGTSGYYLTFGEMSVVLTGLSGSHTFRVRGERLAGSGLTGPGWDAGATYPMQLIVEDIGAEVAAS